jgi:hypothetical protein
MAFDKTGEIKVFKKGDKVGPKLASRNESNRFTVDDLVNESNDPDFKLTLPIELDEEKEEDVSN